ncbi:hypothetical protein MPSEU_000238700 [Mayamaea pseudoterrestris]|nr:hypothetical protein MPSEU_000238700 [Mayamaea pseudoterrestris]
MPTKSIKRKSPGASKSQKQQAPTLEDLPNDVQQQIQHVILQTMDISSKRGVDIDKQVKTLLKRLRKDLGLSHLNPESIRQGLADEASAPALERLIADAYRQTQRAHRVFRLLDTADKGVVIVEDLQRVCQELDQNLEEDELDEMINQYAQDGLLTKDDLVKIARQVGL